MRPVTVVVINFNGKHHLGECLKSIGKAEGPIAETILVDDCSTDGSVEFVETEFPWVRVIAVPENRGPAAARNIGLQSARTDLVALLDNDLVVDGTWLAPLVETMDRDQSVALCSSRVLVYEKPELIDREGDEAHFVGMPTLRNANKPVSEVQASDPLEVGSSSGISMLVDKTRIGASTKFDEDYFYGLEDLDYCLMIRILGHKCFAVPGSKVYHKYLSGGVRGLSHEESEYSPRRAFYMFRNRWLILLKFYALRTLFVLSPALLMFEFTAAFFAVKRRVFATYLRAWASLFGALGVTLAKRRRIEAARITPDRELLTGYPLTLGPGTVQSPLTRKLTASLDWTLRAYWKMAKRLL